MAATRQHSTKRKSAAAAPVAQGALFIAFELAWGQWKLGFGTGPASNPRLRSLGARNTQKRKRCRVGFCLTDRSIPKRPRHYRQRTRHRGWPGSRAGPLLNAIQGKALEPSAGFRRGGAFQDQERAIDFGLLRRKLGRGVERV
jgi:hypothetical protein